MWQGNWRDIAWSRLGQPWDIVIIGGGITGAGILREASKLGLRCLLVEQRDFAWGTSSRSSKMVHGGLRYLRDGNLPLVKAAVQERERLIDEGPGLIEPLGFLLPTFRGAWPGRWTYEAALSLYDVLAHRWDHPYYDQDAFKMLVPHITGAGLDGGFRYRDAWTDDARLTIRVIREAVADGGVAISYVAAEDLLFREGWVAGVRVRDREQGRTADVFARAVINATGAWADRLRSRVGASPSIRPLRGSHLVFPAWRFPVAQAVGLTHPIDHRYIFVIPWYGVTVVGTTDLDHDGPLDQEQRISPQEVAYLMAAVETTFPSLGLTLEDVIATFSGVRPVIGTGKVDPSREARDHEIWEDNGLLTVTGGKLTTFRLIALDVLRRASKYVPDMPPVDDRGPVLNRVAPVVTDGKPIGEDLGRALVGRHGLEASALMTSAQRGELEHIPGTPFLWAELRWAARCEGVVHLDDLLLRRVRLGFLLPDGGSRLLPQIRAICQPELGWDDDRWESEEAAYLALWREIEREWETPPAGDYVRQALAGVPFYRTPKPRWESLHDIQAILSRYELTGEDRYRQAFAQIWQSILASDIHNTGGFTSGEQATGNPYDPRAIETCCTVAWMVLSVDMLRLTGDPRVADELERSFYNAALGAQSPSGRWWTYNTPMDGVRRASAHEIVFQAREGSPELNCCSVNGPRALGILSEWGLMRAGDGLALNAYGPGRITATLASGQAVTLSQETDYPCDGRVTLTLSLAEPTPFALSLRIPGWSRRTVAALNGQALDATPGSYLRLERTWRAGDLLTLSFDLAVRTLVGAREAAGRVSLLRGPLLLAYDRRYNAVDPDELPPLTDVEGRDLPGASWGGPAPAPWLLVEAPTADGGALRLCDFASAGAAGTPYRTWLPARA